ncbi:hypothetical protein, partial [Nevskia soli]|uniref:hypothetical protein n=1 Tax=Nevskia soli TaxID=418856 RepID=UPI0015D6C702
GVSGLWAQSLDPNNPTPLKPGVNSGHVDTQTSVHYWSLTGEKGIVKVSVSFRSVSILGANIRTPLGIEMYPPNAPDKKFTKTLFSTGDEVEYTIEGPCAAECTEVLAILPPRAAVNLGGDYKIQAIQGIRFAEAAKTEPDSIVTHHFRKFGCNDTDPQCAISFLPNGVIALPGGDRGTWKLFDQDRGIYVLVIGNQRQSLKFKPGVGLVSIDGNQLTAYKEVR